MTSKTETEKKDRRFKQPRDIEYFFREKVDGMTIDEWVGRLETQWCFWGWFEKENGIMFYHDRTEPTRWVRNPFHKDDDKNINNSINERDFEMLWVNSNGVVINSEDIENNKKNKQLESDGDLDFQELYEYHWGVLGGMLDQMTINYRNGTPKFIGRYQDIKLRDSLSLDERVSGVGVGKRNGMFIYQNEQGCSVGGEYKDNELIKTYSGLMTISTMQ